MFLICAEKEIAVAELQDTQVRMSVTKWTVRAAINIYY